MTLIKPEKDDLLWQQLAPDGKAINLRRSYRRRFALLGTAAISILAIVLFSSYLRSSSPTLDSAPANATGPNPSVPSLVYPTSTGRAIPYTKLPGLSFLKYSGATGVSPQWAPVPNYSGQITNGGDVAIVDATSAKTTVSVDVTITNLSALSISYSSFAFPVDIYEWCPTNTTSAGVGTPCGTQATSSSGTVANTAGSWVPYENGSSYGMQPGKQLFLTNSVGSATLSLPKGFYYDMTMDPHQGSYYCISTSNSNDLSPSFYINAKAS